MIRGFWIGGLSVGFGVSGKTFQPLVFTAVRSAVLVILIHSQPPQFLKAIAITVSLPYTVQSSVINLGILLKSPVFRVSNTKLLEMAIAAILKSIVDTRTF